jgi:tetratricopeptide (TPR) repeat protein
MKDEQRDERIAASEPLQVERLLRQARREGWDAADSEYGFLETLAPEAAADLASRRAGVLPEDDREMAQELAFQAYEGAADGDSADLAEQALALDPGCVDALTVQAFAGSEDAGELIERLESVVAVAEDQLGDAFFEDHTGEFWSLVPARPYLRALKQLAEVYWEVGRRFDSVETYEGLMDLDPDDHQGNSVLLLSNYLGMGEVQRAWDLLEEYDEEDSALHAWAWVLLLLMSGDEDGALDALDQALDLNPYVAPWFLGMGDHERPLGAVVAAGGEDEAQLCMQILGEAWERSPSAQIWLSDVLRRMGLLSEEGEDEPRSFN